MSRKALTELAIKNLKCPADLLHLEVFDTEVIGLYIDVFPSGKKSYRLRYRNNKVLKVTTLGDALRLSLKQVRTLAQNFLQKQKHYTVATGFQISEDMKSLTIQDFFNIHYLPYVKSYKRSWSTDASMIKNHIVPKLGSLHMGQVSPPDIAVFLDLMKSKGYALGTCNRALVMLRYGFELALKWKMDGIHSNPLKEIKNLVFDNKIERYLNSDQTLALMKSIQESENEQLQHIVLFLIYTGARKREVLDAKWIDIDQERKSWRIPKTKSGKIRHVPLSAGALVMLDKLRLKLNGKLIDQIPIFANPKTGLPYVSFFYSWDKARTRAGLKEFRIHDLRHSFASCLVNAGRSLYEVQELLGHADIKTTSRYAHLSRERLNDAVNTVPQIYMAQK
jgi:site-specific recombinase XerD